MEIQEWARKILESDSLEEKLFSPAELTDCYPGPKLLIDRPSRPPGLEFNKRTKEEKLPKFHEHHDVYKRGVCLHRFAGHELLAVEMMAYTLLALPDAPPLFRKGVAHTLKEEQDHVRLYLNRLSEMGIQFGDHPLYKHFWVHTPYITSPARYVSIVSLTMEMANLDFAPMYKQSFERSGDPDSAALMQKIWDDEVSHVRFGCKWLDRLKPSEQTSFDCWEQNLEPTLLSPKRAKGFIVHETPRLKAGLSKEWIEEIKQA